MKEFKTMTGEEIMNTPLPQTNFVVSELLLDDVIEQPATREQQEVA